MKKNEYGKTPVDKYIRFIEQGKEWERERILKIIDEYDNISRLGFIRLAEKEWEYIKEELKEKIEEAK